MDTIICLGRVWTTIFEGAYSAMYTSEHGDVLELTFEGTPRLNGTALLVYGEDCDEVLLDNQVQAEALLQPVHKLYGE